MVVKLTVNLSHYCLQAINWILINIDLKQTPNSSSNHKKNVINGKMFNLNKYMVISSLLTASLEITTALTRFKNTVDVQCLRYM